MKIKITTFIIMSCVIYSCKESSSSYESYTTDEREAKSATANSDSNRNPIKNNEVEKINNSNNDSLSIPFEHKFLNSPFKFITTTSTIDNRDKSGQHTSQQVIEKLKDTKWQNKSQSIKLVFAKDTNKMTIESTDSLEHEQRNMNCQLYGEFEIYAKFEGVYFLKNKDKNLCTGPIINNKYHPLPMAYVYFVNNKIVVGRANVQGMNGIKVNFQLVDFYELK